MKRRNIRIRTSGQISDEQRQRDNIRTLLRADGSMVDNEQIEKFVALMDRANLRVQDLSSALAQGRGDTSQAVQVSLFYNEHAIDQLILSQGVYTDFNDTANQPNWALRNRGETELIMRRITIGDTIMLAASHSLQATVCNPASVGISAVDMADYWWRMWQCVLHETNAERIQVEHLPLLMSDPWVAAGTALSFCQERRGMERLSVGNIVDLFGREGSPFYTGLTFRREQLRVDDGYIQTWTAQEVHNGVESLYMTATLALLYALDNFERGVLNGDCTLTYPRLSDVWHVWINNHRRLPRMEDLSNPDNPHFHQPPDYTGVDSMHNPNRAEEFGRGDHNGGDGISTTFYRSQTPRADNGD
jgi:hypothetical protein